MRATHRVRLAAHFSLMIAAAACGDRIRTPITAQGQEGTLTLNLRIDGRAQNLGSIWSVAVSDDGTLGLTSFDDGLIRYYSASGENLDILGGSGEFSAFSRIGWIADTLWVYDAQQQRIALVSPGHAVTRTLPFIGNGARPRREDLGQVPAFRSSYPVALASDGSMIAELLDPMPPIPEGFYPFRTVVGLVSAEGEVERILAVPPAPEGGMVSTAEGVAGISFTNRPAWDVSLAGDIVALAMAYTTGRAAGTLMLKAWNKDGVEDFSRRYPIELDSIPRSIRDSTIAARVEDLAQRAPGLAAALKEAGVPDVYPPLAGVRANSELRIGRDSSFWIQFRPRPEGRPVVVLEPDGDVLGTLFLPVNARIAEAERNRIWAVERDSADVESVVVYDVAWEERAASANAH